jgi:hypothetical protein
VPPSAISNRPMRSVLASVKGALDVAEQLALEHALRQAARVHAQERARGARRRRAWRASRDAALARPLSPVRRTSRRRAPRGRPSPAPAAWRGPRATSAPAPSRAQRAVLGLQALAAPQGARQLGLGAQHVEHARVLPRLLQEVARAPAHGLDAPGRRWPRPSSPPRAAWGRAPAGA